MILIQTLHCVEFILIFFSLNVNVTVGVLVSYELNKTQLSLPSNNWLQSRYSPEKKRKNYLIIV